MDGESIMGAVFNLPRFSRQYVIARDSWSVYSTIIQILSKVHLFSPSISILFFWTTIFCSRFHLYQLLPNNQPDLSVVPFLVLLSSSCQRLMTLRDTKGEASLMLLLGDSWQSTAFSYLSPASVLRHCGKWMVSWVYWYPVLNFLLYFCIVLAVDETQAGQWHFCNATKKY